MFVAPSILIAEEAMKVRPRDFRMWVALHEATHQVQFATAPWSREHMRGLLSQLVATPLSAPGLSTLAEVFAVLGRIVRGQASMVDLIRDEGMRTALTDASAILSLLEGHADVVMDEVGLSAIPSVRKRAAASRRAATPDRAGSSPTCSGWTSNSHSTATGRSSSARSATRSGRPASAPSTRARRTCPRARRSTRLGCGSTASTGEARDG